MLTVGLWYSALPSAGQVGPPFTQCPPVGSDTACAILLVIEQNGSLRLKTDPVQGPFDGSDDTLIGVQNNSSQVVTSMPLRGVVPMCLFDGDGICGYDPGHPEANVPYDPAPPACPYGPTGYEGPGVSFTDFRDYFSSGMVHFAGGLQPGNSTYFSLEETIQGVCPAIVGVPLLRQDDAQWRCDLYGDLPAATPATHPKCTGGTRDRQPCTTDVDCPGGSCCTKENTIGHYGCNLTSVAMIINYFAAQRGVGFSTTPATLNAWLSDPSNRGYSAGDPDPTAMARYAILNGAGMYYWGRVNSRDDFVVDQFVCNADPVILRVSGHPHHFVVATGQTTVGTEDTYAINDPGHSNTTLQGYNFTYDGVRAYSQRPRAPNALYIRAHSPVELLLTDPLRKTTGRRLAGGPIERGIPESSYDEEAIGDDEDADGDSTPEIKELEVLAPEPGWFLLQVLGTGAGPFTIEVVAYDDLFAQERSSIEGAATPGAAATYEIGYHPGGTGGFSSFRSCPNISGPSVELSLARGSNGAPTVTWTSEGPRAFDVIRGDLNVLLGDCDHNGVRGDCAGGSFAEAMNMIDPQWEVCMADDTAATSVSDGRTDPPPRSGEFLLLRGVQGCGADGSYNDGSEVVDRNPAILTAPGRCP